MQQVLSTYSILVNKVSKDQLLRWILNKKMSNIIICIEHEAKSLHHPVFALNIMQPCCEN